MRRTLIELAWASAALALTLLMTWAAAWAYPLGTRVVWATGGVAALGVVAINAFAVARAVRADRAGAAPRD